MTQMPTQMPTQTMGVSKRRVKRRKTNKMDLCPEKNLIGQVKEQTYISLCQGFGQKNQRKGKVEGKNKTKNC